MPNKLKKLYRKLKKGFKKHKFQALAVVAQIPRTRIVKQSSGLKKLKNKSTLKDKIQDSSLASLKPTTKISVIKILSSSLTKKLREKTLTKASPIKTKTPKKEEKNSKIGRGFRKSFKKVTEKVKGLKIKKRKKIIGSKKLAVLLTSATIAALLPMFSLNPVPALAATSTCVFAINFIMIQTIKKFLKQRKEANNLKATINDISVTPLSAKEKIENNYPLSKS